MRNSLDGALPQLLAGLDRLRARASALGISFDIADFGGIRTQADTVLIMAYRAADYAAAVVADPSVSAIPINTWRPIAPFGSSMHNYGAAFDVEITDAPGSFDSALQQLKAAAPSCGLRSTVPNDPPHFELPISLDEARAQWQALGNIPGSISAPDIAAASSIAVVLAVILVFAYVRRR
jgi:hypothetical protein